MDPGGSSRYGSSNNDGPNSSSGARYVYDDNGIARNVEPLEMIQEATEYSSSSRPPPTRGTRRSIAWPFYHPSRSGHSRSKNSQSGHSRTASEAPSTAMSMSTFSNFRWAGWQHRSFLRLTPDDATSVSRSIVPDYIVNYIRGETPETLALRREQQQQQSRQGARVAGLTPPRDTYASFPVEYGHYYSSSTDLTQGVNGPGGSGGGGSSASRHSGLRRHLSGWRGGVVFNSLVAVLVLGVELVLLIVVSTRTRMFAGDSAVWVGSCDRADRIGIGLRALVNIFGVALLAGANYAFQVLSSPTRREVDRAHGRKRWLDIGVPSVRNLRHISGFRATLASIVLFTAVSIQVIYNATIYITRGGSLPGTEPPTDPTTTCTINLNGPLFGIVMLLNLALVLSMATILARSTFAPLATVGDALRSFLRRPDPATEGACMLTKQDARRGRGWGVLGHSASADTGSRTREPLGTPFVPRTHLWLHFPSAVRWMIAALAWLSTCGPAAVGLALLLARPGRIGGEDGTVGIPLPPTATTPPLFPALGIAHTAFLSPAQPASADRDHVDDAAVQTALLSALPQLPVALLYLAANALLTTYFLGHEYASYAAIDDIDNTATAAAPSAPRPLRVSSTPSGQQTTGLYLTLPRPVSWALLALFAGAGFLASQAVSSIVVIAAEEEEEGRDAPPRPLVALTVNTTALVALCALLAALAAFVLVLGLRRPAAAPLLNAHDEKRGLEVRANPLAQALRGGSCSAVFSAACHPFPQPFPPSRAAHAHTARRRSSQPLSRTTPSPRRLSGRLPTPMSPFSPLAQLATTAQTQPLPQQPTTPLTPSPSSPSLLLSPSAGPPRLAPLEEEGEGGGVEGGAGAGGGDVEAQTHESARGVVAWGVVEDPASYSRRRGTVTTAGIASSSENDSYHFNDGGPAGGGGMRVGRCAFSGAVALVEVFDGPGPGPVLTSALGPVDLARRYA